MFENWGRGWNQPPPVKKKKRTRKPARIKRPTYTEDVKRYHILYSAQINYREFQ